MAVETEARGGRGKVLLIAHDAHSRDDCASRHLQDRGYEPVWTCPAAGDALPEIEDQVAAIVYGGIQSVSDHVRLEYLRDELAWIARWLETDRPFLGICLGSQLLAHSLGARVGPYDPPVTEYGFHELSPTEAGRDLLPVPMHLYQAHYETFELPAGAELLVRGETYPNQAFRSGARAYGFQFHPEVTPTLMRRWLDLDPSFAERPGAHGRDRQLADAEHHQATMSAWFRGFLDRWIDEPTASSS